MQGPRQLVSWSPSFAFSEVKKGNLRQDREAPYLEPPLSEREEAQGKPQLLFLGDAPSAEEAATC